MQVFQCQSQVSSYVNAMLSLKLTITSSSKSIGGGAIAGIVISVVFIIGSLLGLFLLLRWRRMKRHRSAEPFPNPSMQYVPIPLPAAATLAPDVSPQFDMIATAQPRSTKRPEVYTLASDEMTEVHRIAAEAVSPGSESNPGSSHYSWTSSSSLAVSLSLYLMRRCY